MRSVGWSRRRWDEIQTKLAAAVKDTRRSHRAIGYEPADTNYKQTPCVVDAACGMAGCTSGCGRVSDHWANHPDRLRIFGGAPWTSMSMAPCTCSRAGIGTRRRAVRSSASPRSRPATPIAGSAPTGHQVGQADHMMKLVAADELGLRRVRGQHPPGPIPYRSGLGESPSRARTTGGLHATPRVGELRRRLTWGNVFARRGQLITGQYHQRRRGGHSARRVFAHAEAGVRADGL